MSTGFRGEPGLDQLIRALTADGHPHELAGRETALAAFRAARSQPHRRLRLTVRPGGSARLGAVAATVVATLGALTAAAYAQALPAPVQHIAYSVFSSFGVPDSQPAAPGSSPATSRSAHVPANSARHGRPSRSASGRCPCPAGTSRPAIKGSTLTLTAARTQIPANGWDAFAGRLTHNRHPEHGVRLVLLERAAGASTWRRAGSGVTGPHGDIRMSLPHLPQNASFELASPDGAVVSPPVTVTVIPHVSFWRGAAQPGLNRLVAESRFGGVGDVVVLEELSGGAWRSVASAPLDASHRAFFYLSRSSSAGHYYRVLLSATTTHGASVSASVREPPAKTVTGTHYRFPGSGVRGPLMGDPVAGGR